MSRIPLLFVLLLSVVAFAVPAFAETDPADIPLMASIQGWVVTVDWVGSKIVLNTGDDEITLRFMDDVQVQKNGQDISINDLNQGDQVTVHFIDKRHAGLVAVSITDRQPL
ncbi:MAG: hypothetical protein WC732_07240 [Candidatus Omnitrophota bacterium]